MTKRQLLQPILDDGLRAANFFNGRLLTAEALLTEQSAYRARDALLGQAIGPGVVHGLWVSLDQSDPDRQTLVVEHGLGVSRAGDPLHLPSRIQLGVTVDRPAPPTRSGTFADCEAVVAGTSSIGDGLYLLTIEPADGYEGSAPVAGGGAVSGAGGCGKRFAVEGVRFRMIYMSPEVFGGNTADLGERLTMFDPRFDSGVRNSSMMRNMVAHGCFGTQELRELGGDLYSLAEDRLSLDDIGALGGLRRAGDLRDGELPLAVIFWTRSSIETVDVWSVRRSTGSGAGHDGWAASIRSQQKGLKEAILLQFQDHVSTLPAAIKNSIEETPTLVELFRFLPPVGAIPVGGRHGLKPDALWKDVPHTPELRMPRGRWRNLLDLAMTGEPISVIEDLGSEAEALSIYREEAYVQNDAGQDFVWFASGPVACRFDVPLRVVSGEMTVTQHRLSDLLFATSEIYAKTQNFALAKSRSRDDQDDEPAGAETRLTALSVGAGQVGSLARTLAVLAGAQCRYDLGAAVGAFRGIWHAQSDILLNEREVENWRSSGSNNGGNGGGGELGDSFAPWLTGVGGTLDLPTIQERRIADLTALLRDSFNLEDLLNRLDPQQVPETLEEMVGRLGGYLNRMDKSISESDLGRLVSTQEEINRTWASFLNSRTDGG